MVRWTGSTGAQARRWSAPVLLSVLAAGAVGPLLIPVVGASAVASAGVGAVTAVGGNVLTDLVKAGIARLGGPDVQGSERDLESELERGVQRILEAGGERAERLRGEIAELLREVGAVGAAIEAVLGTGDRRLQAELAAGLAAVGEEFGEFGFVLSELRVQLGLIREGIDRQGGRLRRQSAQLQLAVDLGYRQATDTRLLLEQVAAIERRTRPGRPPEPGAAWSDGCPYRGLVAFTEADAGVFYGRETVTAQLVARLAQRLTGAGPLVVTGASGAGKSSLLRAGLLPAAGRGELSEAARQWPRHVLDRPTGSPLERLAILVAGLAGLDAPGVLRSLTREPGQAHLLVRQALDADARRRGLSGPAVTGSRLILAVDQFEELFTLDVPDERRERAEVERDAFITALHAAASAPAGPDGASAALVVIAVRGDFIDRCAQHPLLAAALQDGPFVVGPMAEADLRRAITGPADVAGLSIEPGLIDTILSPLRSPAGGYDAGALPLLSQAMLTIWEHREDDRLTGRGYALTGGVTQAVATSAEAAYADLDPGRRRLARHVFHRLTAVSRDGPARPAHRPAPGPARRSLRPGTRRHGPDPGRLRRAAAHRRRRLRRSDRPRRPAARLAATARLAGGGPVRSRPLQPARGRRRRMGRPRPVRLLPVPRRTAGRRPERPDPLAGGPRPLPRPDRHHASLPRRRRPRPDPRQAPPPGRAGRLLRARGVRAGPGRHGRPLVRRRTASAGPGRLPPAHRPEPAPGHRPRPFRTAGRGRLAHRPGPRDPREPALHAEQARARRSHFERRLDHRGGAQPGRTHPRARHPGRGVVRRRQDTSARRRAAHRPGRCGLRELQPRRAHPGDQQWRRSPGAVLGRQDAQAGRSAAPRSRQPRRRDGVPPGRTQPGHQRRRHGPAVGRQDARADRRRPHRPGRTRLRGVQPGRTWSRHRHRRQSADMGHQDA
ncbi:hypothetical protein LUX33_46385 [Actinomadura madurae]|nr:hypothetical protein [Actinomadura madurae]MCP9955066.1 hypothetical protein [Actinomadura madurae]